MHPAKEAAGLDPQAFEITSLGEARVPSPLRYIIDRSTYVADGTKVPLVIGQPPGSRSNPDLGFERAGPREHIFFDPALVRAGVMTCGGLCPGLNNVIRSIVLQLWYGYRVKRVLGLPYGYAAFQDQLEPIPLGPEVVEDINDDGGTMLGTSRVPVEPDKAVDYLAAHGINMLFAIGGEGTHTAAHLIYQAAQRRGRQLALVGVPKTIDNDIPYVFRTFGYLTAIERARAIISSAHNEARSLRYGVGLVKLMGRDAGFVAAGATLASQEVNFALIPEIPVEMQGPKGFLAAVTERLTQRHHAVVVVAEGLGRGESLREAGSVVRVDDVGPYLRDRIKKGCTELGAPAEVKYLDPAYYIRSVAANSQDALFCDQLARDAVHAAMAGKTDMLIGYWYNLNTHVPIALVRASPKKLVSERNEIWRLVLQTTGQPPRFT